VAKHGGDSGIKIKQQHTEQMKINRNWFQFEPRLNKIAAEVHKSTGAQGKQE
jgi:hypothetical protein